MLVYREGSPSGCVLIPQVSHAWLAWQLAEHWGNRRFARPSPQAEVLAAILLHDNAFTDFDADPGLDESGRIRSFDRMPVSRHLELWRTSVIRAVQHSRYTGLLVAAHFARLASMKAASLLEKGDTAGARSTHSFHAELERLQFAWKEDLGRDARYEHSVRGPGWELNSKLLVACDKVAVFLCASFPSPFTTEAMSRSGETVTSTFEVVDERTWRVSPWPLKGDRVRLRCEGKRVPSPVFRSETELREALTNAPVERLTFVLQKASARKK